MSDARNEDGIGIKTPKQLAAAVAAGFLVPIIGIVLLAQYVAVNPTTGAGSKAQTDAAVVARIAPIADRDFILKDVNAPRILQTGMQVYTAACAACHTAGAAGAPKFGDTAGWSVRIAKGYDTLVKHAIGGIGAMPAKGGNTDLDDVEVARAVAYMANQAGAKFKEPEAPAPAAAASSTPAESANPATMPSTSLPVVPDAAASAPAAPAPTVIAAATPEANLPAAKPVAAALSVDAGKKTYEAACQACHGAGIAGAPKFGDKLAWADRIKQGNPVLYEHAIKGYVGNAGVMPAKGGSSASDDEVKAAVDYMTAAVK